ncbi:MAG TPA: glycosyltransferase [Acidimicrobiales bacterium]|nr:glycosyltransferase [Acidimicrobiales bacterium]
MSVARIPFASVLSRRRARIYGILSTYPPTPCGLATFSAALARGLEANGAGVGIVRVADGLTTLDPRVLGEMDNGVPTSLAEASAVLSGCDVAIVQHDYGLYGGTDGDEVLDVLADLTVPSIVVAHTVLTEPTDHQRKVLEAVVEAANAVVVMAQTARRRLCDGYDVDRSKVTTVHHGAATPGPGYAQDGSGRPMLLTWGLLGPGKGIEWAIDAMAGLEDMVPRPRYVVAGRTHPKVLSSEGEAYRRMLVARARDRGVAASVTFDSAYRDLGSLTRLVQGASVVVLPYDSHEQVTSGVLVDALAAGRPVVATAFPHAVELLASGAGIVVPQGDASALARALRRVISEPGLAASMEHEAARLAPAFAWPAVASQYIGLADRILIASKAVPA